jgi:hypothetical protein
MADLNIGELVDAGVRTGDAVSLPTADLTTHGVIVGMTGSGKTGLAMVLLEEILSSGVPCLLIDPKGDLGNLCLLFPDFATGDFRPWIDESAARKEGLSPDDYATQQAETWRRGLADWGITHERVRALRDGIAVTIYTPGSLTGVPLDIVGSLDAPQDLSDMEVVRDEIEGYVTGLLGLVGIAADPLSSREHILLANLIESAWTEGRDLDLATLVGQLPQPPLRKLGVFDLDVFFPAKDRMALAMRLNALLASPAFAAWGAGPPIDVESLLHGPDGRARAAIVSLAHLSDEERQFVVSLLLAKLVTWMRRQSGTSDLRALLYMDEVAGYVPPTANPATKKPIMLLMKQARAFGVGVVLATQNPVDVDYKALSNAGTWMIGRLQTERDKARLLDGMRAAAGSVDISAVSDTISSLGKRQFVLRRAGTDRPETFTSRWAMSYLRGPLDRDQVAQLMEERRAEVLAAPVVSAEPAPPSTTLPPPPPGTAIAAPPPGSSVPPPPAAAAAAPPSDSRAAKAPAAMTGPPPVAAGVAVRWLDPAAPWASAVGAVPGGGRYQASAVARVSLLFDDDKSDLRHTEEYEVVLTPLGPRPDVSQGRAVDYDDRDLRPEPPAAGTYIDTDGAVTNRTYWTTLQRDLVDHLVRTRTVDIHVNRPLKLYARVGESFDEFSRRCRQAADLEADKRSAALRTKYETRAQRIRDQLIAATGRLDELEAKQRDATTDMVIETAGGLLGAFLGGRKTTKAIARAPRPSAADRQRRATASAKVSSLEQQYADLEAELQEEMLRIDAEWAAVAERVETLQVPLEKNDVRVTDLALVWVPVP